MKVYKIKNVTYDRWCLAGLRTTKGPGKVWTTLALAKAAITAQWQHHGHYRTDLPKSKFACNYRIYEYEQSLKGIRHGGDLYDD